jgi:hydroxymethylbilane synthase
MLSKLHDETSDASAKMERQLLADWGGGCHQRFGATAIFSDKIGSLMWIRGVKPDNAFVEEFRWHQPDGQKSTTVSNAVVSGSLGQDVWDGSYWRAQSEQTDSDLNWSAELSDQCVFVSHARAVRGTHAQTLKSSRVWTSGSASWFKLAAQGVWVEGCAELLGYNKLKPTLNERVLQLAPLSGWTVLTHEEARSDWTTEKVVATYKVSTNYSQEAKDALKRAKYIFWSSGSQFEELHSLAQASAHQACGLGKTADRVSAQVKAAKIFPSVEEWRKWVTNTASSR